MRLEVVALYEQLLQRTEDCQSVLLQYQQQGDNSVNSSNNTGSGKGMLSRYVLNFM